MKTKNPGNPLSPKSRRTRKRREAEERAEARARSTDEQQLAIIAQRRGASAREKARLQKRSPA